jgi:hypothetical protein
MSQMSKKQVISVKAKDQHREVESLRAKREQLCLRLDTAIRSINSSIAALQRINAQQSKHFESLGIRLPEWDVQHEWFLEAIAEALAYPKTGPSLHLVDMCHMVETLQSNAQREASEAPMQQLLPLKP